MCWEGIARLLMENMSGLFYIAEKDSYELLLIGDYLREALGIEKDDMSYVGKKCYEVIHNGQISPCVWCPMKFLKHDEYSYCTFDDEQIDKRCEAKAKLTKIDGKDYCFCMTEIIDNSQNKQSDIEKELEIEKTLIKCVKTLESHNDIDVAMDKLCEIIANYFKGDRSYLFEVDEKTQIAKNTYEWVSKGITREINNLENIPLDSISILTDDFKKSGLFYDPNIDENMDKSSHLYNMLSKQGIHSLIAVPIIEKDEIKGFLGVDNPRENYLDTVLLSSIVQFVQNNFEKRNILKKLTELSYLDSLTEVNNRNKYNIVVEELVRKVPKSLGIVYMDLNGLKQMNDNFGHKQGDMLIQKAAEIMKSTFGDYIYRIGGDEFVVICDNISADDMNEKISKLRLDIDSEGVNISVGTNFRDSNPNIRQQLRSAEKRMYAEKQEYYMEKND